MVFAKKKLFLYRSKDASGSGEPSVNNASLHPVIDLQPSFIKKLVVWKSLPNLHDDVVGNLFDGEAVDVLGQG